MLGSVSHLTISPVLYVAESKDGKLRTLENLSKAVPNFKLPRFILDLTHIISSQQV